jgi:glycyl-tRNA synthetase beta chain
MDADGNPGKALIGFAQSCGVTVEQLEKLETDKGAWFVFRTVKPGQLVSQLVPEIVDEALKGLPIPKPMRWADHDYTFVRPVHWLVLLHGAEIIDGVVLGLKSGRKSRGHRFMHPQPVHVAEADSWPDAMRMAKVIADPAERRQRIRDEVAHAAKQTGGAPRLDDALLDEIANLTEWPVAIACTFEREFSERTAGSVGYHDGSQPEIRAGFRRTGRAHRALHRCCQRRKQASERNSQRL